MTTPTRPSTQFFLLFAEQHGSFPALDHSLPIMVHHPDNLDLFVPVDERQSRRNYAQQIEQHIQSGYREFRLHTEHVVAIMLVNFRKLHSSGVLSTEVDLTGKYPRYPNSQPIMRHDLSGIEQFCKHYMLHIDPKNLTDPAWAHALYRPPMPPPPREQDKYLFEHAMERRLYNRRFQTDPSLPECPRNMEEETKCRDRDGDACVVTGRSGPELFWFIPFTWNDTVEHNDTTGHFRSWGNILVTANLWIATNPVCNSRSIGGTHKAWNMLSVDPELHKYLKNGRCAFKFSSSEKFDGGMVCVTLQFYWMPQLKERSGRVLDIHGHPNQWFQILADLDTFCKKGCPPPSSECDTLLTKSGEPLRSGHGIQLMMPEREAKHLKSVVAIHWACVVFTALCGGAGRPVLMSCGNMVNPEIQWINKIIENTKDEDY